MQTEFQPEMEGMLLLDQNQSILARPSIYWPVCFSISFILVTLNNFKLIARSRTGDTSFKCLPYQLSMVGFAPTMVVTGNGESGFDSGEGA